MKDDTQLKVLLLTLLNAQSPINNEYVLRRFFAKSSEWADYYNQVQELLVKGLLQIVTLSDNKLVSYEVTDPGRDYLTENYRFQVLQTYCDSIEPTGFFSKIIAALDPQERVD